MSEPKTHDESFDSILDVHLAYIFRMAPVFLLKVRDNHKLQLHVTKRRLSGNFEPNDSTSEHVGGEHLCRSTPVHYDVSNDTMQGAQLYVGETHPTSFQVLTLIMFHLREHVGNVRNTDEYIQQKFV